MRKRASRATAGIGPNLFLAKVALDITAKHCQGRHRHVWTRQSFKQLDLALTGPSPTSGRSGAASQRASRSYGMRDLAAACADADVEAMLYREFGVNAEYLIDHACGDLSPAPSPTSKPTNLSAHSLGNGQVLPCDYTFDEARMVLREMVDETALELVDKQVVASSVHLYIGYKKDDGKKRSQESSSLTSKERTEASEGIRGGSDTRA